MWSNCACYLQRKWVISKLSIALELEDLRETSLKINMWNRFSNTNKEDNETINMERRSTQQMPFSSPRLIVLKEWDIENDSRKEK